jgi:hypothetical protein
MATTITNYSVELSQNAPVAPNTYAPLRAYQYMGRFRISTFTYTFASDASGVSNALCRIPQGALIVDFVYQLSATMGGTCTLAFGLMGADGNGYIDDSPTGSIVTGGSSTGADTNTTGTTTVADSTTALLAATALTATTITRLTVATSYFPLYRAAKDLFVTVTVGAASASTQKLQGYVIYVLD